MKKRNDSIKNTLAKILLFGVLMGLTSCVLPSSLVTKVYVLEDGDPLIPKVNRSIRFTSTTEVRVLGLEGTYTLFGFAGTFKLAGVDSPFTFSADSKILTYLDRRYKVE